MADSELSALTTVSAIADDDVFYIVDSSAGTGHKVRADALRDYAMSQRAFIRADVDRTLPNDTNLNPLFGSPTNGRLTLETGVYLFEGIFIVTAMSATSGNAQINILGAGTATIGSWMWKFSGIDNSTPATISSDLTPYFQTNVTAASAVTAGTGTAMRFEVRGSFECTTAGTLVPSIDQVTASAAVVQDGSYFMVERIGASGLVSVGAWD